MTSKELLRTLLLFVLEEMCGARGKISEEITYNDIIDVTRELGFESEAVKMEEFADVHLKLQYDWKNYELSKKIQGLYEEVFKIK